MQTFPSGSIQEESRPKRKISIGICATGQADNLAELLDMAAAQNSTLFEICKIIVVASGCHIGSLSYARKLSEKDGRLVILEEQERRGKAEAINKILSQREGDYLVFINSDALPEKGALSALFNHILSNEKFGIVSASPYFDNQMGQFMMPILDELIWSIHNQSALELNHMGLSNHSSDEMMIVRSDLIDKLPEDLVNDGAFVASKVKQNGFSVGFSTASRVRISVPRRALDLIRQRRRIIFGHFQVRGLTGKAPITVESMLFHSPLLSIEIVARSISSRPRLLLAFPVALVTEAVSAFLALIDVSRSSKKHAIWKRYEN